MARLLPADPSLLPSPVSGAHILCALNTGKCRYVLILQKNYVVRDILKRLADHIPALSEFPEVEGEFSTSFYASFALWTNFQMSHQALGRQRKIIVACVLHFVEL